MPQTKSAKKALRTSRRRTKINDLVRKKVKNVISLVKRQISLENVRKAQSLLDRAAKKKVISKKKASRIKSRIFRLLTKSDQFDYTRKSHAQKPDKPSTKRRIRKKTPR